MTTPSVQPVKRRPLQVSDSSDGEAEASGASDDPIVISDCRTLRSRYLAVRTLIKEKREDITKVDSEKFKLIFDQVESLHKKVQKPREQVADAEALLGITNTLVLSVKAQNSQGITLPDFISSLIKNFGRPHAQRSNSRGERRHSIAWKEIGQSVLLAFMSSPGCCTMTGPMNDTTNQKGRRPYASRKRKTPTESTAPKDLGEDLTEKKTETDKNIAVIFDVLRKKRKVQIENLLLNRNSFAQTVENLFALSFLIKDGRAEIQVDDKGLHYVSPRNAPSAYAIMSKEVAYEQFIFRLDYKDWKVMRDSVTEGEELMPHRSDEVDDSQPDVVNGEPETAGTATPIRKLSRNRGLVSQDEQPVVENSPTESRSKENRAAAIRKGKRKVMI